MIMLRFFLPHSRIVRQSLTGFSINLSQVLFFSPNGFGAVYESEFPLLCLLPQKYVLYFILQDYLTITWHVPCNSGPPQFNEVGV